MKKYLNWKSLLGLLAAILTALGLFLDSQPFPTPVPIAVNPRIELDQMAPKGYSLFPIQPLNHEALLGVMGAMGTVAIYDSQTSRLVVDGLKLLRSQQDPQTFVALVPDEKMSEMIKVASRIIAVLKNSSQSDGTNFVNKNRRTQRTVFYGLDSI